MSLLVTFAAPAGHADSTTPNPSGITLVTDQVVTDDPAASPNGRLHELTLASTALGEDTPVRVLLPPGYDDPANAGTRYPVLFLLHGMTDDFSCWSDSKKAFVASLIGDRDLIVVMPDGGEIGWYSDWLNDGPKWESYHIRELVPWVDTYYRTIGTREQRAIAGYSMGGFGTMSYAARHPDLFVAAASLSGAVDTVTTGPGEELLINGIGGKLDETWGSYSKNEIVWRDHNPPDLAPNLKTTRLAFYVGEGVPSQKSFLPAGVFELALFKMNTTAHLRLQAAGVDHEYRPDPYGSHEYWFHRQNLGLWLPRLDAVLANPQPRPSTFTYRTAESDFSVWGWTFHVDRAVKEFAQVHFDPSTGLTATGTGQLEVTTPPGFEAGEPYVVTGATASGASGVSASGVSAAAASAPTVIADNSGRLTFSIDLGPSNTKQQSTFTDLLGRDLVTRTVTIAKLAGAGTPVPAPTPTPTPGPSVNAPAVSPVGASRPSLPQTGGEVPAALVAMLLVAAMIGRRLGSSGRRDLPTVDAGARFLGRWESKD